MFQEKRLSPRVEDIFPVQFLADSDWVELGMTYNLSEGGLGVKWISPPNLNSLVYWRSVDQLIKAQGRIAWVDEKENRCGIEIIKIDEQSKNRLLKRLNLNSDFLIAKTSTLFNGENPAFSFIKEDVHKTLNSLELLTNDETLVNENVQLDLISELLQSLAKKTESVINKINDLDIKKKFQQTLRSFLSPWLNQVNLSDLSSENPEVYEAIMVYWE